MGFREGASRWDEIFDITNANLALNRDHKKRWGNINDYKRAGN
jgi:hypothetical protein